MKPYTILVTISAVSTGALSAATTIGLDFYFDNTGWGYHQNISSGSSPDLGVASGIVPQAYWNTLQLVGGTLDYTVTDLRLGNGDLADDLGSAPFSINFKSAFVYSHSVNVDSEGGTIPRNNTAEIRNFGRLSMSQMGANTTTELIVNLTNIPYDQYDIIVYLGMDATGRSGMVGVEGGEDPIYYTTQSLVDYLRGDGSYLTSTANTIDDATMANYVRFSGLSGLDQELYLLGLSGNVAMTAIQIVQIPEPASVLFLGLSSVLCLTRRKRF